MFSDTVLVRFVSTGVVAVRSVVQSSTVYSLFCGGSTIVFVPEYGYGRVLVGYCTWLICLWLGVCVLILL